MIKRPKPERFADASMPASVFCMRAAFRWVAPISPL